ncbi:MAG: acylneuraminate cytidylyltransferase family protein [Shewanella sp.]|uniref:acylneuraminate cytidylyltransferase family protein n=1 Tax=Shewanella sp. TaxID=50422 RepID=UPI002647F74D|nr:acylneuraminate cytidylyltransferase family protein [Shewanella sp.]MDN5498405.1 acylneuraminate cytidylyltransferase family protein [Shewanella sp.]
MITVFLPCRLGSQRVPDKNIRNFAGIEGGLLRIKLEQLCKVKAIDSIVLSSNDPRVLDFAAKYSDSRLTIDERPDELGRNTTTTDELIQYVPKVISEGHILWTHVTSPFLTEQDYERIIECYFEKIRIGYDSLMTVLKLQGFIWDKNGPVSYKRKHINWPMTQNIEPFYEIDSGVFLSTIKNYVKFNDRIGRSPYLFEQDKSKSIDIDWPEDFNFAEKLYKL